MFEDGIWLPIGCRPGDPFRLRQRSQPPIEARFLEHLDRLLAGELRAVRIGVEVPADQHRWRHLLPLLG